MSQIKGFTIVRSPQRQAERWFELYRTTRRINHAISETTALTIT
jgi:hypothetical protein